MLKKFLRDVLFLVVGRQAEGMSDLLHSNKHVNEFLIAKKLGLTINQTRNILYKIANKGLVSSIRKKDKKKGWYTYFWQIDVLKSLEFLKNNLYKKIEQHYNQIKSRQSKQFYVCENCNLEFNEENALLHDFTCSECGKVFAIRDNSKIIKDFKRELTKLEKELELVNEEIGKEKKRLEKKMEREKKKRLKISKKKLKKKLKKIIRKKTKPTKKIKGKVKKSKTKKKKKKKARSSVVGLRKKVKKAKKNSKTKKKRM